MSLDALSGAVKDLSVNETRFGHRDAYATVQYTATFAAGADPAPYDEFVREFRAVMEQYWGTGASLNWIPRFARTLPISGKRHTACTGTSRGDPAGTFTLPVSVLD